MTSERVPSRRLERTLLVAVGVVLVLVGITATVSIQRDRRDHRRQAEQLLDPTPGPTAGGTDAAARVRALEDRLAHERAATSVPGELIDSGTSYGEDFSVRWQTDGATASAWFTRSRKTPDPITSKVTATSDEVEVVKFTVGASAYLLGFVPQGTAAVRYEAPGQEPVPVVPRDLHDSGGDPDAPLLVAQALPLDRATDSTLVVTDADGRETAIDLD